MRKEFPKYLMKVNGQRQFLTLKEAAVAYDSGFFPVEFSRYVLDETFSVRKMTDDDRQAISNAADEYSFNK